MKITNEFRLADDIRIIEFYDSVNNPYDYYDYYLLISGYAMEHVFGLPSSDRETLEGLKDLYVAGYFDTFDTMSEYLYEKEMEV